MNKNGLSGELLETLQLKGYRWLSPAQPSRGLRNTSSLHDRSQGAEHPDIQIDEVHGIAHGPGWVLHAISVLGCRMDKGPLMPKTKAAVCAEPGRAPRVPPLENGLSPPNTPESR